MTQPEPAQTRHTVDTLTDDELTRLYARAEKAERAVDHLADRYRGAELEVQQWRDTYGEHALRRTLARLHDAETALSAVRAELEALRHPELFDGTVNDMAELYAVHRAITDNGGILAGPVHRALDALRTRWDLALRHEQQRRQGVAPDAHPTPKEPT
ncbi:hypothetical protein [Streptomyces sp. NPDC013489]|uniref:hypothetical protein n=1 Tax=Streptomyces sp. NPDC013489 TaxID=3155606 RepID=UPI0033EC6A3E